MSDAKQNPGRGGQRSGPSRSKKKKSRKKKVDPAAFWGNQDLLPTPAFIETETLEPVAVVASLGNPPIPGQQASSQHYFRMVYGRASQLGLALGHAGGLDDLTPDEVEADLSSADDVEIGNRIETADAGSDDSTSDGLSEVDADSELEEAVSMESDESD